MFGLQVTKMQGKRSFKNAWACSRSHWSRTRPKIWCKSVGWCVQYLRESALAWRVHKVQLSFRGLLLFSSACTPYSVECTHHKHDVHARMWLLFNYLCSLWWDLVIQNVLGNQDTTLKVLISCFAFASMMRSFQNSLKTL